MSLDFVNQLGVELDIVLIELLKKVVEVQVFELIYLMVELSEVDDVSFYFYLMVIRYLMLQEEINYVF
jgi:hypothetical protein